MKKENGGLLDFHTDNYSKRLEPDRRQFSYSKHYPERRSGENRRNGNVDKNKDNSTLKEFSSGRVK